MKCQTFEYLELIFLHTKAAPHPISSVVRRTAPGPPPCVRHIYDSSAASSAVHLSICSRRLSVQFSVSQDWRRAQKSYLINSFPLPLTRTLRHFERRHSISDQSLLCRGHVLRCVPRALFCWREVALYTSVCTRWNISFHGLSPHSGTLPGPQA